MTVLLEAKGLSAGYGGVPAISGIDLSLNSGEIVALVGGNGAGKSTTLLTLSGAIRPTAGEVTMFGGPAERTVLRRVRAGLALLPEKRAVIRGLTVRQNLLLGSGGVDAALEHFPELERRLDTRAGLISGGEQQMLSLGRILAGKPRIILADEISLGLAPLIVERLLAVLSKVAVSGVGVLIVEQHPRVAMAWSNRAYVMRRGKIEVSMSHAEYKDRESDILAMLL